MYVSDSDDFSSIEGDAGFAIESIGSVSNDNSASLGDRQDDVYSNLNVSDKSINKRVDPKKAIDIADKKLNFDEDFSDF